MSDSVKIKLLGDEELNNLFQDLSKGSKKSILISAFRKASKPLVNQAKQNLSGTKYTDIAKSIGVKGARNKPLLTIGARKFGQWKGQLGHIVNTGTKDRYYTIKKGLFKSKQQFTGKIEGNHFWDNAIDTTKGQVVGSIEDELTKSFIRFVKRANNRNKR
ncbi:hypothetical protein E9993_01630 [Labilibacter sediminis]|nr:hypothetical protein E9993_01630 [Labilibacter sediminis]